MGTRFFRLGFIVVLTLCGCREDSKLPREADRVVIVENLDSATSVQISQYYQTKRGVSKVLQIHCPDSAVKTEAETIDFATFQSTIEKPLAEYLAKDSSIDFVVLTKGIPIRLTGAPTGLSNTRPSLDSYIAAMGYAESQHNKVVIDEGGYKGNCFVNRYFNSLEPFSHAKFGGYLVTRLDGYTVQSVMSLIDRAIESDVQPASGNIFLDANATVVDPAEIAKVPQLPTKDGQTNMEMISGLGVKDWNADLQACADSLKRNGVAHEIENTPAFIGGKTDLMGYASWGSNDGKFDLAAYKALRFKPGAIAETAVSTSGRTFLPTKGGQSLSADLIEAGVTGIKGYCDEPFLPAIASPTILFDRYTKGWTLAESFYAASRFVGWEDIVIGDPLARPFRKTK